jgi:hypothetical protein
LEKLIAAADYKIPPDMADYIVYTHAEDAPLPSNFGFRDFQVANKKFIEREKGAYLRNYLMEQVVLRISYQDGIIPPASELDAQVKKVAIQTGYKEDEARERLEQIVRLAHTKKLILESLVEFDPDQESAEPVEQESAAPADQAAAVQ